MTGLLLTASRRERWRRAFPQGRVATDLAAADTAGVTSIWLDLSAVTESQCLAQLRQALALQVPVIALAAVPDEGQALHLMQAGAQGYCHVEAAEEQLREVALVVEHGGLWMPPTLLQRFLALSTRVIPPALPGKQILNDLTSWEEHLATLVGSAELRTKFGQAGKDRFEREYDITAMATRTRDVYQKLVSPGRRP